MPQKCPCPNKNPPAQTIYPLQGGKVHPNFENQKKISEKKSFSLHYDKKNTLNPLVKSVFARDSIYAKRAYAIAIPSVCLSLCPSVTRVDQSKTVEVRIMQFSPYSSPIPLVFAH